MHLSEEFFLNGYTQFALKDTPLKARFLESIRRARDGEFDHQFCWRSKYGHSKDFKESIFDYDQIFIDILIEPLEIKIKHCQILLDIYDEIYALYYRIFKFSYKSQSKFQQFLYYLH